VYDRQSSALLWSRQDAAVGCETIAFSPDGKFIAWAGDSPASQPDHSIRMLRVADGTALTNLAGHTAQVRGLAFTPDGRHLISSSEDHTIRAWRMSDLQPLPTLVTEPFPCRRLKLSADGRTLLYLRGDDPLIARRLEGALDTPTRLTAVRTASGLTLSWSRGAGVLERSPRVGSEATWVPVTDTVVASDLIEEAHVAIGPGVEFYRLRISGGK
jgi:WD40 repeat protein